jgi:hypothetical protein
MPKLPIGDIGPCEVVWDYGGTAVKLSPFLGKVELTMKDSISKVFEEGYGDAPVDGVFAGSVMELTIPMTRSTLAQLEKVLPGSSLAAAVLTLKNKCGSDMYANAKQVCIKPMKDGIVSATKTEWTLIYKAHPYKEFAIPYSRSEQRVFAVKFLVFPSLESGEEGEYGQVGVTP